MLLADQATFLFYVCVLVLTWGFYQISEMDGETRMLALFLFISIFHAFKSHLKAECKQYTDKNTKTKEMVTGSQNGLIVRVLFLVSLLEAFSTLLPVVHKDMASLNCSVLYRPVQNVTLHSRRRE